METKAPQRTRGEKLEALNSRLACFAVRLRRNALGTVVTSVVEPDAPGIEHTSKARCIRLPDPHSNSGTVGPHNSVPSVSDGADQKRCPESLRHWCVLDVQRNEQYGRVNRIDTGSQIRDGAFRKMPSVGQHYTEEWMQRSVRVRGFNVSGDRRVVHRRRPEKKSEPLDSRRSQRVTHPFDSIFARKRARIPGRREARVLHDRTWRETHGRSGRRSTPQSAERHEHQCYPTRQSRRHVTGAGSSTLLSALLKAHRTPAVAST